MDCSKGNKFSLINRFSYVRRSNENEVSLLSSEEPLSSLSQDNSDDPKFLFELNNIFFGSPTDPIERSLSLPSLPSFLPFFPSFPSFFSFFPSFLPFLSSLPSFLPFLSSLPSLPSFFLSSLPFSLVYLNHILTPYSLFPIPSPCLPFRYHPQTLD